MAVALIMNDNDGARVDYTCVALVPCKILLEVFLSHIACAQRELLLGGRGQGAVGGVHVGRE
jgi:hypothetical protein